MTNKIILKKEIYDRESIKYVVDIFSEIATFSIKEDDSYYILLSSVNSEIVIKEFENYLIGICGKYGF